MYLSRIVLDASRRSTMRALAEPQMLHGAVERSFAGPRQRNLWRVDYFSGRCCLLVLSREDPDFASLCEQFAEVGTPPYWESRDYSLLLERLESGQKWHFRLSANPVRSGGKEEDRGGKRGKVHAHMTAEQQKKWLFSRAEKLGFALEEDGFDVVSSKWYSFAKGENRTAKVLLHAVAFEGTLEIRNAETFKRTLCEGVGRGKAYGCGLLTIAQRQGG